MLVCGLLFYNELNLFGAARICAVTLCKKEHFKVIVFAFWQSGCLPVYVVKVGVTLSRPTILLSRVCGTT
jgi:hypothetical protein